MFLKKFPLKMYLFCGWSKVLIQNCLCCLFIYLLSVAWFMAKTLSPVIRPVHGAQTRIYAPVRSSLSKMTWVGQLRTSRSQARGSFRLQVVFLLQFREWMTKRYKIMIPKISSLNLAILKLHSSRWRILFPTIISPNLWQFTNHHSAVSNFEAGMINSPGRQHSS